MSDTIEEKNNSFENYYRNDNFDDDELQARLYSEIYYKFDSVANETNVEPERLQHELEEQSSTFGDFQKINPVTYGCESSDNESPEDFSVMQRKEEKENFEKCTFPKYTNDEYEKSSDKDHNDAAYSKNNVLKCMKEQLLAKQTKDGENSDSEESVCEVLVPPKPKPLLIDLQDSDEESNSNSGTDDLILKKWGNSALIKTYSRIIPHRNRELETLDSHQNISSKSKNTDGSSNSIVNCDKNIQTSTHVQKVLEDYTVIQNGRANEGNKSIEDTNQKCKKKSLQNKLNGNNENNANLQHEMSVTSERKLQMRMQQNVDESNVKYMDQEKMSGMESCNLVMDRKRQYNDEGDSHSELKRQCTIQQNDQDVMLEGNNNGEKKNTLWNECFKPMSEEMINHYNSNHGQENFDIKEVQQDMKPPELLYCCNCAKSGHESSMCKEWSKCPTPAIVTNYTDYTDDTYISCTPNVSELDSKTGFLAYEATTNRTSIPQNAINVQRVKIKDVKPSATLLSANFCVSPTSQEAMSTSQIEGNLKSSPMVNISPTNNRKIKSKYRKIALKHGVVLTSVIHSYGSFPNKNHKDARMIMENLSYFFKYRKCMLNSLKNNKVTPVFLQTLVAKSIEFEMTIGLSKKQDLWLKLVAMEEFIDDLFDLLRHWLNLPNNEKDYGIDVTLPINPIIMFNCLNLRLSQIEKMRVMHEEETNDPQWIYKVIKADKSKLKECESKEDYNRTQQHLFRLQIKLLSIANTLTKLADYLCTFQTMMERLESERYLLGEKLNTATYLRLVLLYNQLFVPHTSSYVDEMLQRIKRIKKQQEKERSMEAANNGSNLSMNEQNINVNNAVQIDVSKLTKKERRKRNRQLRKMGLKNSASAEKYKLFLNSLKFETVNNSANMIQH